MPIREADTILDAATVERLSTAFNRCFATLEVEEGVFTDDAFFDMYPPFWRFQLQGPKAFETQLRAIANGKPTVRALRVVPTASGFVLEHSAATGATWSSTLRPVIDTDTEHTVTVSLNGLMRCYRLKRAQP